MVAEIEHYPSSEINGEERKVADFRSEIGRYIQRNQQLYVDHEQGKNLEQQADGTLYKVREEDVKDFPIKYVGFYDQLKFEAQRLGDICRLAIGNDSLDDGQKKSIIETAHEINTSLLSLDRDIRAELTSLREQLSTSRTDILTSESYFLGWINNRLTLFTNEIELSFTVEAIDFVDKKALTEMSESCDNLVSGKIFK